MVDKNTLKAQRFLMDELVWTLRFRLEIMFSRGWELWCFLGFLWSFWTSSIWESGARTGCSTLVPSSTSAGLKVPSECNAPSSLVFASTSCLCITFLTVSLAFKLRILISYKTKVLIMILHIFPNKRVRWIQYHMHILFHTHSLFIKNLLCFAIWRITQEYSLTTFCINFS